VQVFSSALVVAVDSGDVFMALTALLYRWDQTVIRVVVALSDSLEPD
jgi:hypothetical protein